MYEKKRSSSELKRLSRESLIGRYGVMAGATALTIALNSISVFLPLWIFPGYSLFSQIGSFAVSFLLTLLISLFNAGMARLALDITYGQKPSLRTMLYPFFHHPDRFLFMYLILAAIQMVLQIPVYLINGIYSSRISSASALALDESVTYLSVVLLCSSVTTLVYTVLVLRFSMASYLLLDYDDIGGLQALKESSRMMKGHKGRFFYLSLSFFGVLFLGVLTCGIGLLWTIPYMETTVAWFYRDLKNDIVF